MKKLNIGLIGAGRMGKFHGETIAHRLVNANLYAVADPMAATVHNFLKDLDIEAEIYENPMDLINDTNIDAVVITSPAHTHTQNVLAAIEKGKPVFCEKPMAINIEEANRVIDVVENNNALVQVGFNRRFEKGFREAHAEILSGSIGTPQLLRSNTRDPKLSGAEFIPKWTIFLETLIHDFDTLRYLNPNSKPIEVYATADALIKPELKKDGFLDTAVVNIKFDNGAMAVADASFQAVYGYDVRAEVFGSEGMFVTGDLRYSNNTKYGKDGVNYSVFKYDQDLLFDSYVDELKNFTTSVINDEPLLVDAGDAVWALKIALASIESVKNNRPVKIEEIASVYS